MTNLESDFGTNFAKNVYFYIILDDTEKHETLPMTLQQVILPLELVLITSAN